MGAYDNLRAICDLTNRKQIVFFTSKFEVLVIARKTTEANLVLKST